MIKDERFIQVNAPARKVYEFIENMPNKFPIYKILETKPFVFLRLLLIDGFRSAIKIIKIERSDKPLILKVGDVLGPFTLTETEKPFKYWFKLESYFFNCSTGYTLKDQDNYTILNFNLLAENPTILEKIWWFFIKPLHILFANKVLIVLKNRIESIEYE